MPPKPATMKRRMPLVCPLCLKSQHSLPQHLDRVCMSDKSREDIEKVVIKEKEDMLKFLWKGRVLDYTILKAMLDKPAVLLKVVALLEDTGHIISNKPAVVKDAEEQHLSEPTEDQASEPETDSSEESPLYQPPTRNSWNVTLRKEMEKHGLYRKHPLDSSLLAGFTKYLRDDKKIPRFKQEVANVSRYMFFMDCTKPSLKFIYEIDKTRSFFVKLAEVGQLKQTVANYLKNLKRFMKYIIVASNLVHKDRKLREDCVHFRECLDDIQQSLHKQLSKEVVGKRHTMLTEKQPSPSDCLSVLSVAKPAFLENIGMAMSDTPLNKDAQLNVMYYLEALLMLKHLQRSGVVKNMTVEEWCSRHRTSTDNCTNFVIGVKEHKTGAQQVATVSLDEEEEAWFDIYYRIIRPDFLKLPDGEDESQKDTFFISSTGKPIYNPSNDVRKLHERFGLESVTSRKARQVFEMSIKSGYTDAQKGLVADYLAHSTATAEKHYRLKTVETAVKGMEIIRNVVNTSVPEQPSTSHVQPSKESKQNADFQVTLDGDPPRKRARTQLSAGNDKAYYDKWREIQHRMRIRDVIDNFPCRRPSDKQVHRYISRQPWKKNTVLVESVCRLWKPAEKAKAELDSKPMRKLLLSQRWKGLRIADDPKKGRKVMTTRTFNIGEVVCDYHGISISFNKGQKLLKDTPEGAMGYLYFYKNSKGLNCCMDGQTVPCPCHPEKDTFGRLINHSRKNPNIKSVLKTLTFDDIERDIIFFIAKQDIKCDEELRFDYGVNRKSFGGEAADAQWLDD